MKVKLFFTNHFLKVYKSMYTNLLLIIVFFIPGVTNNVNFSIDQYRIFSFHVETEGLENIALQGFHISK